VTPPIRTCAGCGRKAPQSELLRFHEHQGSLTPGLGPGRGAYTCRRLACFERAVSRRAFNRTLRRTVRVDPTLARLYTERLNGEPERTEQTEPPD
jgi:predicted RNA-binding protein YlxR (DUF448 family)